MFQREDENYPSSIQIGKTVEGSTPDIYIMNIGNCRWEEGRNAETVGGIQPQFGCNHTLMLINIVLLQLSRHWEIYSSLSFGTLIGLAKTNVVLIQYKLLLGKSVFYLIPNR